METTHSAKVKPDSSLQKDKSQKPSTQNEQAAGIIADNDSGTPGVNQDSSNKGKGPAGENL